MKAPATRNLLPATDRRSDRPLCPPLLSPFVSALRAWDLLWEHSSGGSRHRQGMCRPKGLERKDEGGGMKAPATRYHLPPVTCYLPPATCLLLPATCYPPPASCYRPPSSVLRPSSASPFRSAERSSTLSTVTVPFCVGPAGLGLALGASLRWLTPPAEDVPAQGPGAEVRRKDEGSCNPLPATRHLPPATVPFPRPPSPVHLLPSPFPVRLSFSIGGAIDHSTNNFLSKNSSNRAVVFWLLRVLLAPIAELVPHLLFLGDSPSGSSFQQ